MKELGSEVAGQAESSQQTQPKTKNPIVRTGRPVSAEQPSASSAQEIDERLLLGCESTNERTGRSFKSCVPVSVERSNKDKDADENVDADQVRTGRPVGSEQSIGLSTQLEEIDIDFRVSGLPHAVVKQAENFRVREFVKKIESHPHRRALQADLQQSNAYNPLGEQKEHFIAHNARRRCIRKKFEGIHDRFQRDLTYRDSQLEIGWTEEKCIEMDEFAQKDFTYHVTSEEYERY